jgi:hypothetical protein
MTTATTTTTIFSPDELRSTLAPYPPALAIYEQVSTHFGQSLTYAEQESHEGAGWVEMGADPDGKVQIVAKVHLHPAVITHESFHVKMLMDGFAVRQFATAFTDSGHAYKTLGNLISHTVFFEEFLAMGFDRQQFFFDSDTLDDLHDMWLNIEPLLKMPNRSKYARAYWNSQYVAQWLAREMGYRHDVNLVVEIGRQKFPQHL